MTALGVLAVMQVAAKHGRLPDSAVATVAELIATLQAAVELSDRTLAERYDGRTDECQAMHDRATAALARAGGES